jgi:5-carboxymethyl-2-hydroxymuconic-semialdehyde dehydrogenase
VARSDASDIDKALKAAFPAWRFMSKAAIRGAENFRYFADQVGAARDGQYLQSPTLMNITTRVPIGTVGVITP